MKVIRVSKHARSLRLPISKCVSIQPTTNIRAIRRRIHKTINRNFRVVRFPFPIGKRTRNSILTIVSSNVDLHSMKNRHTTNELPISTYRLKINGLFMTVILLDDRNGKGHYRTDRWGVLFVRGYFCFFIMNSRAKGADPSHGRFSDSSIR